MNLGGISSVEKATCEVLAGSAKRKSPLGSILEEEYPVWRGNISHLRCFKERPDLCFGAANEIGGRGEPEAKASEMMLDGVGQT